MQTIIPTLKTISTLIVVVFHLSIFAQTNKTNLQPDSTKSQMPFKQKDNTNWVENLRHFRNALYKGDKSRAIQFIDFPFKDEGNDIWYLAYSFSEKAIEKLDQDVKPFTEKDFNQYFNSIFPKPLIKCFLKIKTDELYKKGKSESPEIKDSITTYQLLVTFENKTNTVLLNFATNKTYKISETEYETAETNYGYEFQILQNGHIKLKKIFISG